MLTFGSLFAGIGGFDLGLKRANMRCVVQVENDKRCNTVLAHHWPNVDRSIEDVKDFGRRTWSKPIDLICGGFPCQDVSIAGQRAGLAGERSGLWFEFIRVIEELKPKWVIVENVSGLLSSNEGRDMGTILGALAKLRYWWAYRILDAQYFGVPQRRRRVFIVGSLGDGRAAEVLFERTSSAWDSAPSRETGQRVAASLTAGAHPGGHNGQDDHKEGRLIPFDTIQNDESQQTYITRPLESHSGRYDANQPYVFDWQSSGDVRLNCSNKHTSALHANQTPAVMQQFGVRRLTPRECERLQGFPDDWTLVDGMSDSARYRMLGNAVAVPVVEWLGRRIVEVENGRT